MTEPDTAEYWKEIKAEYDNMRRIKIYATDGSTYSEVYTRPTTILDRSASAMTGRIKEVDWYEIVGEESSIIVTQNTPNSDIKIMNHLISIAWEHHKFDDVIKNSLV